MEQSRDERAAAEVVKAALSALMDGEADAAAIDASMARWREDAEARRSWHAYQTIGDVLRSDELAACRRDAAFMQRLHERLSKEPTVLAPAPDLPATLPPRDPVGAIGGLHRWAVPMGLAAGVALVLGTVLVVRQGSREEGAVLAEAQPNTALEVVALTAAAGSSSAPMLLRDPRLDRYLAAHKQFQSANAMGPATGFIRSATYDAAAR